MKKYIMVIDEGTTGTRALLFDRDFHIVSQSYVEFTQYTPSEDKVEHDAMEIWEKTVDMCRKAMEQAGAQAEDIAGIGITNQRATAVIWDKETGEPLCRAIVWQDCARPTAVPRSMRANGARNVSRPQAGRWLRYILP